MHGIDRTLTIPSLGLRLMRVRFPAFEPINISQSRNTRNKAAFSSSAFRNALDSQAIGQSESRCIRFRQDVDGGGRSHGLCERKIGNDLSDSS